MLVDPAHDLQLDPVRFDRVDPRLRRGRRNDEGEGLYGRFGQITRRLQVCASRGWSNG